MTKTKKLISATGVIIVLAVISLFLFSDNGKPKDFEEIKNVGVLRIVTDYNSVGYFVSGDTIAGFNYDLIQLLKQYIPLKIEIKLESGLDKSIEGLKYGKYDVMARNIPITSELRGSLIFTEPVAQNRQVLVQRKKEYNDGVEPLRSHLALAKKTLYVAADSPAILRIRNLSHEIGDTIYIKEDPLYSAEQLAMQVASGEIDYAVCDEKRAAKVAESLPEIDYSTLIGFTHIEAWVVSEKSPVLLDSLNQWIRQVKNTKEYDRIYQKYYN
ncbi:transporter substrate-binding domain-containing protein [Prevotella sp. 10(H)]|uniref:transporter substrate-binding domain-containing protein n=1 Tax=Prevotella sp. 10(H) TaxID=1158294 RepID=UPI0004A6AD81|nr:transporter substrate-binding domain-containing protein [Prevotella sp. 10(H)]